MLFDYFHSLWVSRTGSTSYWCDLQEVLYKCIDTIQYDTMVIMLNVSDENLIKIVSDGSGTGETISCFIFPASIYTVVSSTIPLPMTM